MQKYLKYFKAIKNFIHQNKLEYLLIFALFFIFFLASISAPTLTCPDGFYHTKLALTLKEGKIIQDFPWTQFTSYKNLFVDHHFGYHLLLVPFLYLPSPSNLDPFSLEIEPLFKTKLATIVLASLIFVLIYWFLKKLKIKGASFYLLAPFLISNFLIRITLTRAPALSIILLILGLYLIFQKKYFFLGLISFFYVWSYGAWPLILLAVITYCFASAIKELIDQWPELQSKIKNQKLKIKETNKKFQNIFRFLDLSCLGKSPVGRCFWFLLRHFFTKSNIKLLSACLIGLILGLIINPYYPKTFSFNLNQLIKIAIVNYQSKIGVGAEWYPYDPFKLLINIFPVLMLWLPAMGWFLTNWRRQNKKSWTLLIFSLFFFLYTIKARRNVEYFVPFALFFSCLSLNTLWSKVNWTIWKEKLKEFFHPHLQLGSFTVALYLSFVFIFFLGTLWLSGPMHLWQTFKDSMPYARFQKVSHWLKDNTPPGSIIYHANWDIFPPLFYFNTENYYINGLDQTFMYEYSPELYEKWQKINGGTLSLNELPTVIKSDFQSNYVLVDKERPQFERINKIFKKSSDFEKIYQDEEALIYKIKQL